MSFVNRFGDQRVHPRLPWLYLVPIDGPFLTQTT